LEVNSVFASVKQEGNVKIGYIRLTEFNSHSTAQMERAMKKLNGQKVAGFVLDLRGNPGGLLISSIEIARLWLNQGVIVKTVDRKGINEDFRAHNTAITTAPLTVLIDGNSASASEILAGALKDNNRAVIVGSQSFGKALVQSVHSLSDGSGITVTIAHYYTPNGTDIGHKGITPDIKVDLNWLDRNRLTENPQIKGSTVDRQYQRAISILQSSINKPTSLSSN
jgi:carboxyl-terminal processing protease